MSELPPIPDPYAPAARNDQPIYFVDLLLIGLVYVGSVTVLRFTLERVIAPPNYPASFSPLLSIIFSTTFGQIRFITRLSANSGAVKKSLVTTPVALTIALSLTIAFSCLVQGIIFQAIWHWLTHPRDSNPNRAYYRLLYFVVYSFFWPIFVTQLLPAMQRRSNRSSNNKTNS